MKRFTWSVIATLVLGLGAFSLADAEAVRGEQAAGAGPAVQQGRGPGWFGRGPGRGGMMALRGIELTEEQRAQVRAIHDAERAGRQGPPAGAQLRRQLDAELYADAPDVQRIGELQQQLAQAESERLAKHVEIQQRIAQVLTPEQRAQVRERLASPGGPRR